MNIEERQKWLEQRRSGIGGSDVPVIFGLSSYKTPFELWQEKTNKINLDSEDTPDIRRGRTMEPIIAEMYTQITSRETVIFDGIMKNPHKPYLIGDPDRKIYDKSILGFGILEIKAPSLGPFGKMVRQNSPRFNDQLQLQHYMLVTGAEWGAIVCHNSERWQLIHWDIDRDNELISQIEEQCEKFWECVQRDIPPETPNSSNLKIPEIQGSPAIIEYDSEDWKRIADTYREAKELEGEVKAMVDSVKSDIKLSMGDNKAVEGHGVRAYLSTIAGRKTLDKKALTKAYPEIDLSLFEKTGKPFEQLKVYMLRGENE